MILPIEALAEDPDFLFTVEHVEAFCPFNAVGMLNQEIRHSRFLSYIFDPREQHGFGSRCLRALLRASSLPVEEASSEHLSRAIVMREWRDIDIVVLIPDVKFVVAIENKINAHEHGGQLEKYRRIVEAEWPTLEGWNHNLVFLTKTGANPSRQYGEMWLRLFCGFVR